MTKTLRVHKQLDARSVPMRSGVRASLLLASVVFAILGVYLVIHGGEAVTTLSTQSQPALSLEYLKARLAAEPRLPAR